jgi:gas vesicle protein
MYTLEDKIKDTQNTIKTAFKRIQEKHFDETLDIIDKTKNIINESKYKLQGLNIDIYDYVFNDDKFYFKNKDDLKNLRNELINFVEKINNSKDIYSGVKSTLNELTEEIDHFNEIVDDMEMKYEILPTDEKISNILKNLK